MTEEDINKLIGKDTKVHCGCNKRAVYIDKHGRRHNKRYHDKDCKYYGTGWIYDK